MFLGGVVFFWCLNKWKQLYKSIWLFSLNIKFVNFIPNVTIFLCSIKWIYHNLFVYFIEDDFLGLFLVWGYYEQCCREHYYSLAHMHMHFPREYSQERNCQVMEYVYFQLSKRMINYFPKNCTTLHFHQLCEFLLFFLSTEKF